MASFATHVRERMDIVRRGGGGLRVAGPDERDETRDYVASGTQALRHLAATVPSCAADPRCDEMWGRLEGAYADGTPAQQRSVLTQMQSLLTLLTAEDDSVAGDGKIQIFRRQLHTALDHE